MYLLIYEVNILNKDFWNKINTIVERFKNVFKIERSEVTFHKN